MQKASFQQDGAFSIKQKRREPLLPPATARAAAYESKILVFSTHAFKGSKNF